MTSKRTGLHSGEAIIAATLPATKSAAKQAKANGAHEAANQEKFTAAIKEAAETLDKIPKVDPVDEATAAIEVERLARLKDLPYDLERKASAVRLGLPVGRLDKLVYVRREETKPDQSIVADIEPWPEPVIGLDLLNALRGALNRHVKLREHADVAIVLWIVFAHCLEAFDISPRLAVTSPLPECGKTTTLEFVNALVPRALLASNITSAATFRAIDKFHPTMIIDEADTFLPNNDELRGVLNSSHDKSGAFVVRTVGDSHEPRRFSTWCAMVIALIGNLPPTLASRSIHIELRRLARSESVEPFRAAKRPYLSLARQAARWADDHVARLVDCDPVLPEGFKNRRGDNWRPLFGIADLVGGDWPDLVFKAALALAIDDGQDLKVLLLEDIKTIFGDLNDMTSKDLVERLGDMEHRPWSEFGRSRKPITANGLARQLKPLHIFPGPIGDDRLKGYQRTDFVDAFERYLGVPTEPPAGS